MQSLRGALTQSRITTVGEANESNFNLSCRSVGFLRFSHLLWATRGPAAPRNLMKHYHMMVLKPLILLRADPFLPLSQILELTLLMASYMNHWNPSLPSASHQPLGHWDVDSRHFPAMNYTTKGPTLLWIVQATRTTRTVWLQEGLMTTVTFSLHSYGVRWVACPGFTFLQNRY